MTSAPPGGLLHVANGTCTARLIEAAGLPGARSIWADPLYEGPVPADLDDEALIGVRATYLAAGEPADGVANDLRAWRHAITAAGAERELVLWFEHDLFDQLNLVQVLSWIRNRPAGVPRKVSLVCIGSFPGRAHFKGLGELAPADLEPLFDARAPVERQAFDLAGTAWAAFRSPDPEALQSLRRAGTGVLPYLGRALDRFLQEYPWTGDGLSRSERQLLRLAAQGPIAMKDAFPRMHEDEDAYYITDLSFAALVSSLSRTSPPLVALAPASDGDAWNRVVTLTAAGRDVLAGRLDRAACGVDRWLGGVHLEAGGAAWRWDNEHRHIIRR
ncbi:MAG TPA: hypothetical protein VL309_03380 [Vicinamibacterales bacterium]|nr:hypothetical protein [Vicinamibacterales bacterium]